MKQKVKVTLHNTFTKIKNNQNLFGSEDIYNCQGIITINFDDNSRRTFGFSVRYLFSPLCRISLTSEKDNFSSKRFIQNTMLTIFKAIIAGNQAPKYWDLKRQMIKNLPDEEIELNLLLYRQIFSQFRTSKYLIRNYGYYFQTTESTDKLLVSTIKQLTGDGCKNSTWKDTNLEADDLLKNLAEVLFEN